MMKAIRTICLLVSSICLTAMTLITVVDVSARYFLNRPIYGSGEMVQYLLAVAVFAGLFIVNQEKGHVSVTLLEGLFLKYIPKTYAFLFHAVTVLGLLGINGILAWQLADYWAYPEVSVVLRIPVHYVIAIMLAFGMLSMLAAFQAALGDIRAHRHATGRAQTDSNRGSN